MNRLSEIIFLALLISSTSLYASGSHSHGNGHSHSHHEMSKLDIKSKANAELLKLIKNSKLDKSWIDASVINMQKKMFGHHNEWVVSYVNKASTNKEKKILYIFVSLKGKITGANFTGK